MRLGGAHRSILGASVSGNADLTYLDAWLADARPAYPMRAAGGISATLSFSSRQLDLVVVANHNIANGASLSASGFGDIPTTPWRADGIPRSYGKLLAEPITASSINFSAAGSPAIVGLLWAGLTHKFPGLQQGRRLSPQQPFSWEGEFELLNPYDYGVASQRRASGVSTMNDADFEELEMIFESQCRGSYPVVWLDDDNINDPWLCQFKYDAAHEERYHTVNLEIVEIPRVRWP